MCVFLYFAKSNDWFDVHDNERCLSQKALPWDRPSQIKKKKCIW
jgi:hypothetical protein